MNKTKWRLPFVALAIMTGLLAVGCAAPADTGRPATAPGAAAPTGAAAAVADEDDHDLLPALAPVALAAGEALRVTATTTIVADIVKQVGGDSVEVSTLLPPGADPHSYQARPDDLKELNRAHVIFINGLNLEEALLPLLDTLDTDAPVISVNAGVPTLDYGDAHADETDADEAHADETDADETHTDEAHADEAHGHEGADPHTWMDVRNVMQWVDTVAAALAARDPAHAEAYAANAAAYRTQLQTLHTEIIDQVAAIPAAQRKLVTDHDNLSYLAHAYGFTVVGTVIPSLSTMAAPSARELAALQAQIVQEGVTAIFVDTTVNANIATQIGADTGAVVVPLYTGSLSAPDGPAATYLDMMRHDVGQIVAALAP